MTISLCVIARNASHEFEHMLETALPHIDELVVVLAGKSTDNTEEIARKYTDKIGYYHADSKKPIDSFSEPRQISFDMATGDWLLWLDTDDELINGQYLKQITAGVPPEVGVIDFPYYYGRDQYGNLTTVFNRERLVRRSANPRWQGRVHEVIVSDAPYIRVENTDTFVNHAPKNPNKPDAIKRNLRLLHLQWKDMKQGLDNAAPDHRTASLYAFQYFAKKDFASSYKWYLEHIRLEYLRGDSRWGEAIWQSLIYAAICARQLKQVEAAVRHDMDAMALYPAWADSYFGMAESMSLLHRWQEAVEWDALGVQKSPPNLHIFLNPMNYSFNCHLIAVEPLVNLNRLDEALSRIKEALKVAPKHELLLHQKQMLETDLIPNSNIAEAAFALARQMPEERHAQLFALMPDGPKKYPAVAQTLLMPSYIKSRTPDRVVIFTGAAIEPWGPPSIQGTGIGGSETAAIRIAEELGKLGLRVDLYGNHQQFSGSYGNVSYWPVEMYDPNEPCLLFVSWRTPDVIRVIPEGKHKWLWMHDLHSGELLDETRARGYTRIMPVSKWHEDYLRLQYPFLAEHPGLKHTTNGIDYERFTPDPTIAREPHRVIYASSPDRGLITVMQILQTVMWTVPGVQLHVYYGFQNLEKAAPDVAVQYKQAVDYFLQQGVPIYSHGRVNQAELAKEFMRSTLWLYPTDFMEVSCITAMEAMAAGCIPLTTAYGALPETIGDGGIQFDIPPNGDIGHKMFVGTTVNLLNSPEEQETWRKKALARRSPTWAEVAQSWAKELE